ncbi:MAG: potassium transporter TrkG, partial [Nitrososphaerales archaeon]
TIILVLLTTMSGTTDDFTAISLIFGTISGGGFAPSSTIITANNLEVLVVTSAGMILSALPFAFHYYVFRKKGLLSRKSLGSEVTVYLIAMGISVPVLYILMVGGPGHNIGTAAYHLISASTTTGFQFLDIQAIPAAAKVFLVLVMLVGGCAFSTAGGIKVGRLLILYQEISRRVGRKPSETSFYSLTQPAYTSISSTANPQRSSDNGGLLDHLREEYRKRDFGELFQKRDEFLKVAREILGIKLVREILLVIGLFIAVAIITGVVLSNNTGRTFEDGLFESVSALSTAGLSAGITSLQLDSFSKLMLTANMILGRFEIIAIFYIFFRTLRH